ncbi:MAG: hypothetical protein KDA45_17090 [Planctomycetales bacterium]|nr:hypothetical protein [Planctomycetales bacterium]
MCASPHDCKFASYGGVRERTDMVHGRVGSVFDPAPEVIHTAHSRQSPAQPTLAEPQAEPGAEATEPDQPAENLPPGLSDQGEERPPGEEPPELPNGDLPDQPLPDANGTFELPDVDDDGFPPSGLPDAGFSP